MDCVFDKGRLLAKALAFFLCAAYGRGCFGNSEEAPWLARALRAGGGKGERRCGSTDACAAVAAWGKERRILAAGPLPLLMGKHTGGGVSIALGFIGNVE